MASFFFILLWSRRLSAICSPTVMVGFKNVVGSWKIMEIYFPLNSVSFFFSGIFKISVPLNRIWDRSPTSEIFSGRSCMMARAVMDFPQPDSPTTTRVSPFFSVKLTSLTAWIRPEYVFKYTSRFRTSRITSESSLDVSVSKFVFCSFILFTFFPYIITVSASDPTHPAGRLPEAGSSAWSAR